MKRFVDGQEVDFELSGAEIAEVPDRLMVRTPQGSFSAVAVRVQDAVHVSFKGRTYTIEKGRRTKAAGAAGGGELHAPMPGLIVDVLAAVGDVVRKGEKILVLEAMKTQQPFAAPFDGTLAKLEVAKGQQVVDGQLLALVEASV